MPTAAKLVAGIGFAITSAAAVYFYFLGLENQRYTIDELLSVAGPLGFILGWFLLGGSPGYGGFDSLWAGVKAAVYGVIIACLVFGLLIVVRGLMNGSYLDPMLPLKDWLRHSADFLVNSMTPRIAGTVSLGALLTGRLAGIAHVRWQ